MIEGRGAVVMTKHSKACMCGAVGCEGSRYSCAGAMCSKILGLPPIIIRVNLSTHIEMVHLRVLASTSAEKTSGDTSLAGSRGGCFSAVRGRA